MKEFILLTVGILIGTYVATARNDAKQAHAELQALKNKNA